MTTARNRRRSVPVMVGGIGIGGDHPIAVQSMTNTDTADAEATARQVRELAAAGSELVRITVNSETAAAQVGTIRRLLDDAGCTVPLIGDFHYNGHTLLQQFPECAAALAKYRINPGNVGFGRNKDSQFATMIAIARDQDKPIRIGVNWGSLDQALLARMMDDNARSAHPKEVRELTRDALVASALSSAERAEEMGLPRNRIVLSCKVSEVQDLIAVYQDLAARCDHALHLGLTEAGMGSKGIVASTAGMGYLLQCGIGDTIRVSLTPEPGSSRTREVIVAQEMLQTLGLRAFVPLVTSCPGCGRTTSVLFQQLAADVQDYVRRQMPVWKVTHPGAEHLTLAVMGCVVNGPGESRHANIGISLPGKGEAPVAPVFIDGEKVTTLRGEAMTDEFKRIVDDYVERRYGSNAPHTARREIA